MVSKPSSVIHLTKIQAEVLRYLDEATPEYRAGVCLFDGEFGCTIKQLDVIADELEGMKLVRRYRELDDPGMVGMMIIHKGEEAIVNTKLIKK